MNIEELEKELMGRTFPETIRISIDHLVVDVPLFLKVSFIEARLWDRELEKSPAWLRLIRYKAALDNLEQKEA